MQQVNKSVPTIILSLSVILILLILVLLAPMSASAQNMYRVHEDVVKPSHVMEYENVVKELLSLVIDLLYPSFLK
mgnify:CR=1 FL=1